MIETTAISKFNSFLQRKAAELKCPVGVLGLQLLHHAEQLRIFVLKDNKREEEVALSKVLNLSMFERMLVSDAKINEVKQGIADYLASYTDGNYSILVRPAHPKPEIILLKDGKGVRKMELKEVLESYEQANHKGSKALAG